MGLKKVKGNLKGSMAFEMNLDGHTIITDGSEEIGGNDLGPRPKALLLAALIGCTGIDIALILKKMRVEYEDLSIEVEAEDTDDTPSLYTRIHMIYTFKGKNLPMASLERAVSLSQEKYCSVGAMLKKVAPITYEIRVEE
ncbi:MAG TPA: OsmC family protein [Clostridiaceae bacterium]|nr:OsmC family protein [Clostridiaceae bacterium]